MLRHIACIASAGLFVVVVNGACNESAASVCDDLCAKYEECGSTCSCNTDNYEGCPNESAILDHLDGCADKPCSEVTTCVMATPSCDGNGSTTSGSSTATSSGATTTGGGGDCAELAQKCPNCTLPELQATCSAAAATGDPASCQDGLSDPDIIANCN